jgi:TldD protein
VKHTSVVQTTHKSGSLSFASGLALVAVMVATLVTSAAAQPAPATSDVSQDPVLRAMKAEMERSKEQLRLETMQRPYYIEYNILDLEIYGAEAAFGAVRAEQRQHARLLRAVVRIGDYKQDSFFGAGEGSVDLVPVDDDVAALRQQLWLTTDRAYKAAIESLTRKQAALKQFEGEKLPDDFSREPVSQLIAPVAKLEYDPNAWSETLKSVSALFRKDTDLESLGAQILFRAQTHYFMNSEGSVIRRPETAYVVNVSGSTQAADGMRLDRGRSWVVATPRELPAANEVREATEKLIVTLQSLRAAPIVEDEYHGPVLLKADAASGIFAQLVGVSVQGRKPRPGTTSRTIGEYASSYKSRVLPDFLSVVDDPTATNFGGRSLLGSYPYDDEGVKARPVDLVQRGELVNYLLSRQPLRDFPNSNGHGRSPGPSPAVPAVGNLFVRTSQPQTFDALKQKLISICKDRGLEYGYLVESVGPGSNPNQLYRVWAKDGHQELVRGGEFNKLDVRALRNDIIAAGDDPNVDNRLEAVPVSVIAPSILFGELEIKRSSLGKEKLPDYPPPALKLAEQPKAKSATTATR